MRPNRDMLSDMLSDDYDIVEAADGEEALSILKERVYDILNETTHYPAFQSTQESGFRGQQPYLPPHLT